MDIRQTNSILVVGGGSTIGRSLVMSYETDSKSIWQTTRHRSKVNDQCLFLDLSDNEDCWFLPYTQIRTAIICAAVTSHEQCRNFPEFSRRINVDRTVALATSLTNAGVFVIFLSSNAVFNGETPFAGYIDPINPQTEYGRQKADTEEQLLKLGDKVAIVRFSKVITPEMPLIKRWIWDLKAGKVIHPFFDMVIAPVPIGFAVAVLQKVAFEHVPGIIQVSANQDVTYADLARYIAYKLGSDKELVKPISYLDVRHTYAPKNTTLDCSRLFELGIFPPDLWTGVDNTFEFSKV
ncbi:MAG: sugar nucleotide-binding protein [Ignavibacteriales bacterium]|nr:sugar nucleotide-binding protein [Ignavibacteriales bacterium]